MALSLAWDALIDTGAGRTDHRGRCIPALANRDDLYLAFAFRLSTAEPAERAALGAPEPVAILSAMRRWLTVFLFLVLPLQLSWGVAAGYCQHEDAPAQAVRHPGHHEHRHLPSAGPADSQAGPSAQHAAPHPAFSLDDDCAFCHLGAPMAAELPTAIPVLRAAATPPGEPASPVGAILAFRLERPNWAPAVPAGR